ncbi:MAG: pilus assembly protein TadG-related protein [Blastocatellia bacterium]
MPERDNESGYALIMVALVLFLFLGFAALAVDVGVASSARTAAQRAADAAALAGAFTFINNPTAAQPATAQAHATATATQNTIMGAAIAAGDVTVTVDTNNRRVTVAVAHSQNTFFGSVVGQATAAVNATGIAEAASSATGGGNVKPFFIPNTALSTLDPCAACTANPKQLLIDNNQPTNWALTKISSGTTDNRFQVKPNNPDQALRPGDFYLIDLSGSTPGTIDEIIAGFLADPGFCSQSYSVLTGNHVGPTTHGIEDMIGCPDNRDLYVSPGNYTLTPSGLTSDTSKSIFIAPIWNVCNAVVSGTPFCPSGKFPGGTQVTLSVVGYALIFMEGFQNSPNNPPSCSGNNAVGRLVGVAACGSQLGGGGGGIDPTETGPFALPLRLVRVP